MSADDYNSVNLMIDKKAAVLIDSLQDQFSRMHLELIRNFMQQETDIKAQLEIAANRNKLRREELSELREEV